MTHPMVDLHPGPRAVLLLLAPGIRATRTAWTAEAALITRCAPSTSAARSTEATFTAPAWASAKASRTNARACESLSIMCSAYPLN